MPNTTSTTPGSTLKGTSGNDTMIGIGDNQTISSGAGKDTIIAYGDNDVISSGDDDDSVTALGNNAQIFTGAGNDRVLTYGNNDIIVAGSGNDTIAAYGRGTRINLGKGDNTVIAGTDQVTVAGTSGKDNVTIVGNNSTVEAGSGGSTVTVTGTNNKVLYNANLSEGNWAKFSANASGSNTVVISLDKPLSASLLSQITKDFTNAQNKLFDFSGYKGILAPIPSDPTGAMMLKVQGFKNLAFNINPSAADDAANVLLNAKYAQLATVYKQNILANDISNNGNELKLSMISKVTSDAAVGKVVITQAESWNAQGGEIDSYLIKTASGTATLILKSDGTVILNSNGAFDNLQKDVGLADLHLNIVYQNSDQLGGHAMATDKITITNTLPAVSSVLDLTGTNAHTMVLGPNVMNDSIDLSTLNSGLTGKVLYTVIGNLGSVDATGHLNISSQALLKANANLSGTTNIDILATDANGTSKVIEVKYSYSLTPAVSQEYAHTMALDTNVSDVIDLSTLNSGLTGKIVYTVVNGIGSVDATGHLNIASQDLFKVNSSLSGIDTVDILATDASGVSKLVEVKYNYNLTPAVSQAYNNTLNLGSNDSIDLSASSGLSGAVTYKVLQGIGSVDATGHLNIAGQALFKANPSLSGTDTLNILATDASGASKLIAIKYGYNLTPDVVSTPQNIVLDHNNIDINVSSIFSSLLGDTSTWTYKLANGQSIPGGVLHETSDNLYKGEDIYVIATDPNGNSHLGKLGVQIAPDTSATDYTASITALSSKFFDIALPTNIDGLSGTLTYEAQPEVRGQTVVYPYSIATDAAGHPVLRASLEDLKDINPLNQHVDINGDTNIKVLITDSHHATQLWNLDVNLIRDPSQSAQITDANIDVKFDNKPVEVDLTKLFGLTTEDDVKILDGVGRIYSNSSNHVMLQQKDIDIYDSLPNPYLKNPSSVSTSVELISDTGRVYEVKEDFTYDTFKADKTISVYTSEKINLDLKILFPNYSTTDEVKFVGYHGGMELASDSNSTYLSIKNEFLSDSFSSRQDGYIMDVTKGYILNVYHPFTISLTIDSGSFNSVDSLNLGDTARPDGINVLTFAKSGILGDNGYTISGNSLGNFSSISITNHSSSGGQGPIEAVNPLLHLF